MTRTAKSTMKRMAAHAAAATAAAANINIAPLARKTPSNSLAYDRLVNMMNEHMRVITNNGERPLFTTDLRSHRSLWDVYLDAYGRSRQHHNCNTCRAFIENYGGLVVVEADGSLQSAVWPLNVDNPKYSSVSNYMAHTVANSTKITGVFVSSKKVLGEHDKNGWHHFALRNLNPYAHAIKTADQHAAEKREDFKNMLRALNEFQLDVTNRLIQVLSAEAVNHVEKFSAPANWLHKLNVMRKTHSAPRFINILWHQVATAPAGFCYPRSSMIGVLLEGLTNKRMSFADVQRQFNSMVRPEKYMRPEAAPSETAITIAEKRVAALGLELALERRYASVSEIEAIWTPSRAPMPAYGSGVFSYLKTKDSSLRLELPAQTMTWVKLRNSGILSNAAKIEIAVNPGPQPFATLVTAKHYNAPPILQWDRLEQRNPVSWFLRIHGTLAALHGLNPGWHEVVALSYQPSAWHDPRLFEHHGNSLFFAIKDAKPDEGVNCLGLFPSNVRSELHEIRSVIEAHNNSKRPYDTNYSSGHAIGLMYHKGKPWSIKLRVTDVAGIIHEYTLDRWD